MYTYIHTYMCVLLHVCMCNLLSLTFFIQMENHYTHNYALWFFYLIIQLGNFSPISTFSLLYLCWMTALYSISKISHNTFNQSSPDRCLFQIFCFHKR